MKRIIITIFIFALLASCLSIYSQNSKQANSEYSELIYSEYDYYEKLRLERKDKNVKTISSFSTFNDDIENKDYYDENGYLRKREIYFIDLMENRFVWKEIFNITYDENGNISGNFTEFKNNTEISYKSTLNNLSPSDFFDIGFGETLVDKVKYIFDSENNLVEKRSYGEDLYGSDTAYSVQYFFYNEKNEVIESRLLIEQSDHVSIIKYFYNENGLLTRESASTDFENDGRDYGNRYEYEFYDN